MKSNKIQPQFIQKYNPRIGLIALATDFIIEKDFIKIIKDKDIDFFVNRYVYFEIESTYNFYSIYGFIMFSIIIFGSRLLRLLLGRPENFYAKKAVDSEDYPGMEEK